MAEPLRRFVVFLASPGDLAEERRLAKEAIEAVNRIGRGRGWYAELVMWEDQRPAAGRPQAIINKDVDTCDLFVGLLWERWGQPTGEYSSGFEEEFERARARRRKTDHPDVWLAFRKVDPGKLRDPGEDLKRVLAFRAKQIEQREFLFREFESPQEWRSKFFEWLIGHILEVWTVPSPEPTGASASGDGAAPSPPVEARTPAIEYPTDLLETARAFQGAIDGGQDPADGLSHVQIARLNLSSAYLMTQIDGRVLLDVIGLNYLYRARREINPISGERWLIYRTLLADRANVVPGWYWLGLGPVEESLAITAVSGGNTEARVRALEMMRELLISPPGPEADRTMFCEVLLRDSAAEVRAAAAEYLGAIGTADETAMLDRVLTDTEGEVRTAAAKATFRIVLRHDLGRAFDLLLGGDRGADLDLVRERATELSVGQLNRALESGNAQIRELAMSQLKERGALTGELAVRRVDDTSAAVRAVAFEALIEHGLPVTAGQIRRAFADEKPATLLSIGPEPVDVDAVILKLYRTRPDEELRASAADWLALTAPVAYRALGLYHFDRVKDGIRRDLGDGFASHEAEWMAGLREKLGSDAAAQVVLGDLRDFIRGRFQAAGLEALAVHGDGRDAGIARRYLAESQDQTTRGAAVRVLGRFGSVDDVGTLLRVVGEAYGDVRTDAARAALALSPGPDGAARELLAMSAARLTALVLQSWAGRDILEVRGIVEDLLNDRDQSIRVKAVSFWSIGSRRRSWRRSLRRTWTGFTTTTWCAGWTGRCTHRLRSETSIWVGLSGLGLRVRVSCSRTVAAPHRTGQWISSTKTSATGRRGRVRPGRTRGRG